MHLQFDLARNALEAFRATAQALDRFAAEELENVRQLIETGAKERNVDLQAVWTNDRSRVDAFLEEAKRSAINRLGDVKARLRQNEYVLQVAMFEEFMKTVQGNTPRSARTVAARPQD